MSHVILSLSVEGDAKGVLQTIHALAPRTAPPAAAAVPTAVAEPVDALEIAAPPAPDSRPVIDFDAAPQRLRRYGRYDAPAPRVDAPGPKPAAWTSQLVREYMQLLAYSARDFIAALGREYPRPTGRSRLTQDLSLSDVQLRAAAATAGRALSRLQSRSGNIVLTRPFALDRDRDQYRLDDVFAGLLSQVEVNAPDI